MGTSPKRQRRKSWVKLWVTGWLHGSIRWQLDSEERGVWADLMALAGECAAGGAICDHDGQAIPRKFIANQLNITQTLLDRVIAKCKHDERIEETELNGVLRLTNWDHYQSEYDRQKPYQEKYRDEKKDQPPGTPRPETPVKAGRPMGTDRDGNPIDDPDIHGGYDSNIERHQKEVKSQVDAEIERWRAEPKTAEQIKASEELRQRLDAKKAAAKAAEAEAFKAKALAAKATVEAQAKKPKRG